MPDRSYTDQEIDAAIAAIADADRMREAQQLVLKIAPSLQSVLASAIDEGGWFDTGHAQAVREAVGHADPAERSRAVHSLLGEETRLGMLVGVAVGFELARELGQATPASNQQED